VLVLHSEHPQLTLPDFAPSSLRHAEM